MANNRFVAYYRVSTSRQGASGLGLEAQKATVLEYLKSINGVLADEVIEIESGKRADRPKLIEALKLCRLTNSVLVIAKLDRLSRNLHFINSLLEAKVEFVCCDIPSATPLTIQILAAVAEAEARAISERTKSALLAAKIRGIRLGSPTSNLRQEHRLIGSAKSVEVRQVKATKFLTDMSSLMLSLKNNGLSLNEIANTLNSRGIKTARGKSVWYAETVKRVLDGLQTLRNQHTIASW